MTRPGGTAGNPGGATGVDTGGVETLDADSAGEADTASREPMSDSTATDDVGDRGGNGF